MWLFVLKKIAFYEKAEITSDEKQPNHFAVAMTSDRGLCGGVHSSISKAIRADIQEKADNITTKIIAVGDKGRTQLSRYFFHIGNKLQVFYNYLVSILTYQ